MHVEPQKWQRKSMLYLTWECWKLKISLEFYFRENLEQANLRKRGLIINFRLTSTNGTQYHPFCSWIRNGSYFFFHLFGCQARDRQLNSKFKKVISPTRRHFWERRVKTVISASQAFHDTIKRQLSPKRNENRLGSKWRRFLKILAHSRIFTDAGLPSGFKKKTFVNMSICYDDVNKDICEIIKKFFSSELYTTFGISCAMKCF